MDSRVYTLALSTGIAVPCLVAGNPSGRPLLLLHAWGESRRSFDRLVPLLTEFRIFAPDLRGHSDADKPAGGYSLVEQAGDASAVLDSLGLASAAVLGSSSGGYVAQQLAVSGPQRVDALILAGAPLTLAGRPAFADEVETLVDPIGEEWVRQSLSWFPLVRPVPPWFVKDRIRDGTRVAAQPSGPASKGCTAPFRPRKAELSMARPSSSGEAMTICWPGATRRSWPVG
ncbi:alpha/beta fold hydrolase [Pseudarthrobacter sp. BRE9]|uniref:alpha/beta fold hydrolase n=1 Tax=Pseudarthrobacter sp. BRE9 TaxID=2962582 RepID=UPI0028810DE8|nr:alpha/beta fold hydrolase [Pseudarthrobacter sp. BRE9]MDT0168025.1 alpha/beta fold hydrolase [Pseudarthrobacter sp. BRE9]